MQTFRLAVVVALGCLSKWLTREPCQGKRPGLQSFPLVLDLSRWEFLSCGCFLLLCLCNLLIEIALHWFSLLLSDNIEINIEYSHL